MKIVSPGASAAARGKIVCLALACLTLTLIVCSALLKLAYPLRNDQALFLLYSINIDRGATLYTDIWDIKQPAVFLFYYFGGKIFGFSDVGVHLFEMVWNIGFAILVIIIGRRHFGSPWVASLAPFFLVIQYVYTSASEQTQVETLVAFPIFASVLLGARAAEGGGTDVALALIAGICAGIAAAFKIPFALICTVVHAYVVVCAWRSGRPRRAVVLRLALPWMAGASLVWLVLLGYFASRGAAAGLLLTTFVYPFTGAMALEQAPFSRLFFGGSHLALTLAPWLCLLAGFVLPPRLSERVPLASLMLIWIGVEVFDILVQRFSWWPYHWFLLLAPLFLLCMVGLDRIIGAPPVSAGAERRRVVLFFLLLAPFTVVLGQFGQNAFAVYEAGGLGAFDGTAFRRAVDRNYDAVLDATAAFPGDCRRDRIFVLGTPAIYTRLGCRFDYRYVGQNLPYITAAQRAELVEQLIRMPPDWILVTPAMAARLERLRPAEPALSTLLDSGYQPAASGDWGTWYRRADSNSTGETE